MDDSDESSAIRDRYLRRAAIPSDRYSRVAADVLARTHERQRALVKILRARGIDTLAGLKILEVGCGGGGILAEFIELGADPELLVGIDLLPERLIEAHRRLPHTVRLLPGEASAMEFPGGAFDIVFQATVFSSILDNAMQRRLADAMWRWVKPGGAVLWYDFIYDNPSNRDVRGVRIARIRELFPAGDLAYVRITLAPPVARRAFKIHASVHALLNLLPILRTHVLCWIAKT